MANIKNRFRFWSDKEKKFIDPYKGKFYKCGRISNRRGDLDISQFTGLFDKNGIGIFEGDVLSIRVEQAGMPSFNFTAIVEYVPGEFILNDGNVYYYRINQYSSPKCYEVITNVYKDPIMKLSLKHPKT